MSVSSTWPCLTRRAQTRLRFEDRRQAGSTRSSVGSNSRAQPEEAGDSDDYSRPSDEALLSRYRDGRRPEDFAEIVQRFSGDLSRRLARYIHDTALAEDALQDTFLQVHAKCGLYRDGWPARRWLHTVAINRAIDTLRRAKRLPATRLDQPRGADEQGESRPLLELLAGKNPGPLEELEEQERQSWVHESMAHLPGLMRQALILGYVRGLSYAEIASHLGIPLGTVKSRLHRAICELRAMAQRHEQSENR